MFLDVVSGLCFWTLSLDDVFVVNVSRNFITCRLKLLVVVVGNVVSTSEKNDSFFLSYLGVSFILSRGNFLLS